MFGYNWLVQLAVGLAQADKMQKRPNVTCCFFGEGAVAESEFHESLNLAALWQVPALFVCENNLYCMGTAVRYHESNTNISEKAASYKVKSVQVDGNDVLAVEALAREAAEFIRAGNGPFFIEAITYRFRPHSMFDAELYRSKAEVEEAKKRDPMLLFTDLLKDRKLLDDTDLQAIEHEVAGVVQHSVDFAEAAAWEPVDELTLAATAAVVGGSFAELSAANSRFRKNA